MHTYLVGMSSFGGVVSASGSMWVGLGYSVDFDDEALMLMNWSAVADAGAAAKACFGLLTTEKMLVASRLRRTIPKSFGFMN